MSEPFLGQINVFPYNFAPRNWAFCDGQLMPVAQYSALFSLLGCTFGGDCRTTFGLPDLRSRVALHCANGSAGPGLPAYQLGQKGGTPTNTLTISQLPSHDHDGSGFSGQLNCKSANADTGAAAGHALANARGNTYINQEPDTPMHPASVTVVGNTGYTGGSQPTNNMQPFLGLNYCIALQGIFPSRN